ncbi:MULTISPECIES: tRNA(His) guanylyltransferase Thg1 family protein [Nocardia]|uniref:tRNA(His) guanylyltransferase Thg1 family protein n=1 Tax=Nocardia TaxID=1817 RepID=UPI002456EACB|nr:MULTISPECIES: tRNA(His) guanylyltransferase Thg1 family protein [Nocardia]
MGRHGDLATRMKRYEAASHPQLLPRTPLLIRNDGRAFHTYTRQMARPFDPHFMDAMVHATQMTAADMQGFKLAYTQSDEATFLLTDYDTLTTSAWFDLDLSKIVSITAALFTAHFNDAMRGRTASLGVFDARAFSVPRSDVPNVFVWRQQDWERNSLSMLARAHFAHRECHGRVRAELHDMLHAKGVNWATDLTMREKNGTFLRADGTLDHSKWTYQELDDYLVSVIACEREERDARHPTSSADEQKVST